MIVLALAIAGLPTTGLGAPYPAAALDGAVRQERCMTSYRFVTRDPLAQVAAFYRAEGAAAGVPLLDDSGAKFVDYRMIVFVQQPRFLDVVLDSDKGRTVGRIAFHVRAC